MMFGSSLPPVVCRMSYLRFMCLVAHSAVQHILCCVFAFLVFVLCALIFPDSLYCPFFIAPSVFFNAYLLNWWVPVT